MRDVRKVSRGAPVGGDHGTVWRGMTRAELDAAYDNSAAVKNSAAKLAEWTERSRRWRAERSELRWWC